MREGDLLHSRFELVAHAGLGAMGEVFRGIDHQTGEPIAIKTATLGGAAAERLGHEARVLSQLDHPGIVRYIGHGQSDGGAPYLVMEWLEGLTLEQKLQQGPLPIDDVVELGRRVAAALAHAHGKNLVHRDLSPSNLLLGGGAAARTKLVDFGLCMGLGDPMTMADAGKLFGTPAYMAPEQVRGGSDLDARADLFSLGCILYEALTGQQAFDGDSYLAVLAKVALAQPRVLGSLRGDVPESLARLVMRLLSKDPMARPASAEQVTLALQTLDGSPASLLSSATTSLSITTTERRIVSVVVAGTPATSSTITLPLGEANARSELIEALGAESGAHVAELAGGAVAMAWVGHGAATDQAQHAVRTALELCRSSPVAVTTGWAVLGGVVPLGDAIDRAVALLAGAQPEVRLDDATSGLVAQAFETEPKGTGHRLVRERDESEERRLLGQKSPFVGRERELATLRALVDEAFDTPRGTAVLLTGPPGIGKSRIRFELCAELPSLYPEARLWMSRADAMRRGSPLGLVADSILDACGLASAADATAKARGLSLLVQRHASRNEHDALVEFLSELVGAAPPESPSDRLLAARRNPQLMSEQIRHAIVTLVLSVVREAPLLLVLEDLHWADAASLKLVDVLLRASEDLPLLVLGVSRPELALDHPELWRDRDAQEIRVTQLTRRASASLVERALGKAAPKSVVDRLVDHAAGNAFFLEELVRAQAEGRAAELPETVVAMVQSRLEGMEAEARRVLRAASVFGASCWVGGVAALVGGDGTRQDVESWLHTLEQREVLGRAPTSRFPAEQQFVFRHGLVRDAAYAMLVDRDRSLGHCLAAAWLERAGEPDAATIAEHYESGGDTNLAAPFWQRAALNALDAGDFDASADLARRGLSSGCSAEHRGALHSVLAEAERLRGHLLTADEEGARALSLLEPGSSRFCVAAGERALVLQRLGRTADLEALGQMLLGLTSEGADGDNLAMARLRTALALSRVGSTVLARALEAAASAQPGPQGPVTLAWVHAVRAISALLSGDRSRYLEQALLSRQFHLAVGDKRPALEQAVNMGSVYVELGQAARAEEMLRAALAEAESLGLSHVAAGAQHNLGLALARLGHLEEALSLERAAIATFVDQDRRLEGGARVTMALIAHRAGLPALAAQEAERGRRLLEDAAPPLVPIALAVQATLDLETGDAVKALEACRSANSLAEALGGIEYGESLLALTTIRALKRTGAGAEAALLASRAATRLRERAGMLSDPELQQSFLRDVEENAALLALAEVPSSE